MAGTLNAFTVDVEDYFHVSAFEAHIARHQWDSFHCRVVENTHRILCLLDRCGVRATFFVLGWVANRFPQLVRDIHRSGHEIGSHSYWHRLVYEQTPDEFRQDLRDSRDALQNLVGSPITAYRAPSFSITRHSLWALDILVEEGFTVDSSIFPIYHDRYGISGAPRQIHMRCTTRGKLCEVPPSAARLALVNVPVGGGYFRFYPWRLTQYCMRRINGASGQPFVFYVHPWELDPQQPKLRIGSPLSRLRHYMNLSTTERKLEQLLQCFAFGSLQDVIREQFDRERNAAEMCALPD